MPDELHKNLNALGSAGTEYVYDSADAKLLETFPNPLMTPSASGSSCVDIEAPEFTSLCPKTGQPDFATIVVSYVPDELCVESKSLKLYLGSFRQARMFHEACVQKITADLVELLRPHYLHVIGQFSPRGGIKFWPKCQYQRPAGVTVAFVSSTSDDIAVPKERLN